ncbi:uncharacterized protein LOC117342862 isoform X2 [Pecten maximus]|uniref:uncharacterized protein LOC117342862 isoform X2 n=1 Tax=Pecten maximus TaxID=6579 RepID=UPI0014590676|nr:uncharacterized protein LOC117342862 isoform X2 [Pecten maximus]
MLIGYMYRGTVSMIHCSQGKLRHTARSSSGLNFSMGSKGGYNDRRRSMSPAFYGDSHTSRCAQIQSNYAQNRRSEVLSAGHPFNVDSRDPVYEREHSPISSPSRRATSEHDAMLSEHKRQIRRLLNDEDPEPMTRPHRKRRRRERKTDIETDPRELVSEVVKRLIKLKGTDKVSMDLLKRSVYSDILGSDIKRIARDGTFEGFLKEYKNVFSLGEDKTVSYNFKLQICKTNGAKPGSCLNACRDLHLCKFHIMSECISSGCRHGHDEHIEHNDQVLRNHFLNKLIKHEVRSQLLELSNRRGLTVPEICTFYNAKGCSKKGTCTFLHVCKYYVLDRCEFSARCKRCHNFSDPHTRSILKSYGLENISEQRIQQLLKKTISEQSDERCYNRSPSKESVPQQQWIMWIEGQGDHTLVGLESRRLEQMYKECLDVVHRTSAIREDSFHDNFAQRTICLKGSDRDVEFIRKPTNTVSRR